MINKKDECFNHFFYVTGCVLCKLDSDVDAFLLEVYVAGGVNVLVPRLVVVDVKPVDVEVQLRVRVEVEGHSAVRANSFGAHISRHFEVCDGRSSHRVSENVVELHGDRRHD